MNYTKANCSSCNRSLKIAVAKGDNTPERVMCKACSQNINGPGVIGASSSEINTKNTISELTIDKKYMGPKTMKLADALKVAKKKYPREDHCFGREKKWHVVNRYAPTRDEAGQRKRIYGTKI